MRSITIAIFLTMPLAPLTCNLRAEPELVDRVFVPEPMGPRDLFALAHQHGVQVRHLKPSVPTLEDVFARAVGEA